MKFLRIILPLILIYGITACTKYDLVDSIEDNGEITLVTDWSNRTSGISLPDKYNVHVNNKKLTYREHSNCLPSLPLGTHTAIIHHDADKVTINNTTATVKTTNNAVETQPGWLFTATTDILSDGNDKTHPVTMVQQIRQLSVTLTIVGINPSDIASVSAKLEGVANTLDIVTDNVSGNNIHAVPVFTRENDKLKTTIRLIGITSAPQNLALDLTYSDNSTETITNDISSLLSGFNTNKHIPLDINANLTISSTGGEAGFTGTITDWTVETGNVNID